MAGSLNHIIDDYGHFKLGTIENMRDACEALHECFHIIRFLTSGNREKVNRVCDALHFPTIEHDLEPDAVDGLWSCTTPSPPPDLHPADVEKPDSDEEFLAATKGWTWDGVRWTSPAGSFSIRVHETHRGLLDIYSPKAYTTLPDQSPFPALSAIVARFQATNSLEPPEPPITLQDVERWVRANVPLTNEVEFYISLLADERGVSFKEMSRQIRGTIRP